MNIKIIDGKKITYITDFDKIEFNNFTRSCSDGSKDDVYGEYGTEEVSSCIITKNGTKLFETTDVSIVDKMRGKIKEQYDEDSITVES